VASGGVIVDPASSERKPSSRIVVVTGLEDDDVITIDEIDESMLFVDSAGPAASQKMSQRLRLADS
jgi:hypothetical protein